MKKKFFYPSHVSRIWIDEDLRDSRKNVKLPSDSTVQNTNKEYHHGWNQSTIFSSSSSRSAFFLQELLIRSYEKMAGAQVIFRVFACKTGINLCKLSCDMLKGLKTSTCMVLKSRNSKFTLILKASIM